MSNIFVKYDNKLIRTYTFSYKEGQYFKTLLSRITHTDPSGDVAMQVTNSTGGHGGLRSPYINAYISNTDSYSKSLSPQYSAASFIQTGASSRNGEVRSNTNMYAYSPNVAMNSGIETSAAWSGQASVNYDSKDTGESDWMDVNGNGLADWVTGGGTGNMKYQLNLGYRLDNAYTYKNAETFASGPVGSIGLSGGFDFGGSSGLAVSVSANASAALGSSKTTFEDINSDGLSDILIVGSSNTYVKYNLGNRFSEPVELTRAGSSVDYNNEAKTYRGGISVGAGYYYTFPILWWPATLYYGFTDPLHIVFRIPSSFICTIIKSIIICIPEYATEAAIMCCNCVGEIILNSMNEYKHPRFQTQELKVN